VPCSAQHVRNRLDCKGKGGCWFEEDELGYLASRLGVHLRIALPTWSGRGSCARMTGAEQAPGAVVLGDLTIANAPMLWLINRGMSHWMALVPEE